MYHPECIFWVSIHLGRHDGKFILCFSRELCSWFLMSCRCGSRRAALLCTHSDACVRACDYMTPWRPGMYMSGPHLFKAPQRRRMPSSRRCRCRCHETLAAAGNGERLKTLTAGPEHACMPSVMDPNVSPVTTAAWQPSLPHSTTNQAQTSLTSRF